MLRYLIKTLLQMNLFTDTIRNPSNGTDGFYNASLPPFNGSLLDWGNLTGFNGKSVDSASASSPLSPPLQPPWGSFPLPYPYTMCGHKVQNTKEKYFCDGDVDINQYSESENVLIIHDLQNSDQTYNKSPKTCDPEMADYVMNPQGDT